MNNFKDKDGNEYYIPKYRTLYTKRGVRYVDPKGNLLISNTGDPLIPIEKEGIGAPSIKTPTKNRF